jgi:tryptophanyl-tRNA synthetase
VAQQISLTGIKPTGSPHIGNYLGAVLPGLALAARPDTRAFYFIADYHALTGTHDRERMLHDTYEVAAMWLAFGLDPEQVVFYRQSDVPEIFELSWVLSCFTPKGFMNKAHAYKAAVDKNLADGEPDDAGIGMGLYTYPVLMAADILAVDADVVPVGKDQIQHVEIARDIAQRINHLYGEGTLHLPSAHVREQTAIVPGLDGRKMSKSYGNTLPCFLPAKKMRKAVMRIKSDSTPPEEPKDPDTSLVFQIHRSLVDADAEKALADEYRAGISWGGAKQLLYEEIERHVAEPRERFEALMADRGHLDELLAEGATKARAVTTPMLQRVREALGVAR